LQGLSIILSIPDLPDLSLNLTSHPPFLICLDFIIFLYIQELQLLCQIFFGLFDVILVITGYVSDINVAKFDGN